MYADDGALDPPVEGQWRPLQETFAGNLKSGAMMPGVFTAMAFDPFQELLWTGDERGRIAALYSTNLQPYTSFIAHKDGGGAGFGGVRQMIVNERGVLSLGRTSVRLASRRGVVCWNLPEAEFIDLKAMTMSHGNQDIVVAGNQRRMLMVNLNRGSVTRRVGQETPISRC